jgi:hypothetical protein
MMKFAPIFEVVCLPHPVTPSQAHVYGPVLPCGVANASADAYVHIGHDIVTEKFGLV